MREVIDRLENISGPEYELRHLPEEERKSFLEIVAVWGGATFATSAFVVGGALAVEITLQRFLIAFPIGLTLAAIIGSLIGIIAMKVRLTFHTASRIFYGRIGSFLPSGVQVITRLGYGGVNFAFAAFFVQFTLEIPFSVAVVVLGILYIGTAFIGINALKYISYITIPLVTIVFIYGLYEMGIATADFGALGAEQNELSFPAVVGLGMASWIAGAIVCADWTRYSRSKSAVVGSTFIAILVFSMFLTSLAVLSVALAGEADLPAAMADAGLLIPATIAMVLLTWSTVDNWLYSASLGVSNIAGLSKVISVPIAGVIVVIIAFFEFHDFILPYLDFIGIVIPPLAAPWLAEYYVINKYIVNRHLEDVTYDVNWVAVLAWITGAATAYVATADFITPLLSVLIAFISYIIFYHLLKDTNAYPVNDLAVTSDKSGIATK